MRLAALVVCVVQLFILGLIMSNAVYLEVRAGVRYWEDADVDGQEDKLGTLIPMRKDDDWRPVVRLEDGKIIDWPKGTTASIHYKVCDDGDYWLLDENKNRIAKWVGFYVPDEFLCHGDKGYGDYIIFDVLEDGHIKDYRKPEIIKVEECESEKGWLFG